MYVPFTACNGRLAGLRNPGQSTRGSLIELKFVLRLKIFRKSLIKTCDNNFAKEQNLRRINFNYRPSGTFGSAGERVTATPPRQQNQSTMIYNLTGLL